MTDQKDAALMAQARAHVRTLRARRGHDRVAAGLIEGLLKLCEALQTDNDRLYRLHDELDQAHNNYQVGGDD